MEARVLKTDQIHQLNVASYMYDVLKQRKYPMLRPSHCISHPSHHYLTKNSNEMLLTFPRVEAIRLNFEYQFVKVWLEEPEYIKGKRSYLQFKNVLSELYLEQFCSSPLLSAAYSLLYLFLYICQIFHRSGKEMYAKLRLIGMIFVYMIYKTLVVSML